jgi:hypothetical protein
MSREEYTDDIPKNYGDVMTVEDFKEACESGGFIDYDGFGNPAKDGKASEQRIFPSQRGLIPADATHIVWYNR